MTLQEKRKQIDDTIDFLKKSLAERYETVTVGGWAVFHSSKDTYFRPFSIFDWAAVGIEYAHGRDEANRHRYEDGDLFYLEDYEDKEVLLQDILKEIED